MPILSDPLGVCAYSRALPGGGYVAIEIARSDNWLVGQRHHGMIRVERRAKRHRRTGQAPIIGEAFGDSEESVMDQLLPIAESNTAIGAALLKGGACADRWTRARVGDVKQGGGGGLSVQTNPRTARPVGAR